MFDKILIANRGEIACRIIRTARRMGIGTVAVYSDADARAPHVAMADEAVRLGPPPATDSYLLAEAILLAARETGSQAVHPGYGFLSERAGFAAMLEEAGIRFIGPPPAAIAAMGDKIESKRLARAAGVSVVPGHVGAIDDTEDAVRIARDIGYPVMMKASAGGGGKGMRLAFSDADVRDTFQSVRGEARASFGDDRLFIEKFVENPRHIEIQILADGHGTLVHLGERECSVQRRHQKVVEEAPSLFATPDLRAAMGAQAIALARAVDYRSAGTVEFIVGPDRDFYFLEMNTRLQVEHPVTEAVTGLDLVEQMIRIAAGEPLGFGQQDVRLDGWAVETRLYAEDPYRGFLPSTGRISHYHRPAPAEGLRVDDGVEEGSAISIHYDPMIAKLITHGPDRLAAIDAQVRALDRYVVEGIGHNIDFLSALMQHPRFRSGDLTTGFIAEEYPEGFSGAPLAAELRHDLAALAGVLAASLARRAATIDGQIDGPVATPAAWVARLAGQDHEVMVEAGAEGWSVTVDGGETIRVDDSWRPGQHLFDGAIGTRRRAVKLARAGTCWTLAAAGASHRVRVLTRRAAELAVHMIEKVPPDLSAFLLCPMPGLLVELMAGEGDRVEAGQPLAIVEAMKMQNLLRATKAGRIARVAATVGESLAVDAVILEFATGEEARA